MTEVNASIEPNESDVEEVYVPADEITLLKERATLMGIKFHPSVGVATLAAKIEAALMNVPESVIDTVPVPVATPEVSPEMELAAIRQSIRNEALRLVRVNITCMNPDKKDWPGEFKSVGNRSIGMIKKYIPFSTSEGYHIPHIIYELLQNSMCQTFTYTTLANGQKMQKSKMIKEYAIEVLPFLTEEELADLAHRQAISNSINA